MYCCIKNEIKQQQKISCFKWNYTPIIGKYKVKSGGNENLKIQQNNIEREK